MVVGVVAMLATGMVVSSLHAARGDGVRERVERFVREHDRREAAATTSATLREPMWGEGFDEDAGFGYALAAVMLRRTKNHSATLQTLTKPDAVAARAAAWPALAPIVEVLQRAAHARTPPAPRCRPDTLQTWVLQIARQVAWDRGDHLRCVQLWLDEVVLWSDQRFPGSHWPFGADWPEEQVTCLEPSSARLLAARLVRIEERWPACVGVESVLANQARSWLSGSVRHEPSLRGRLWSWANGFDPNHKELATADALLSQLHILSASAATWPERERQWQQFHELPGNHQGGCVSFWMCQCYCFDKSHFIGHAKWRLLRLALAFQLREPLPDLVDPRTGKPFVITIDGDVATFRSEAEGETLTRWAKRR
jgi:hypothetical protein